MKKIIPFLAGLVCAAACSQAIENPESETKERVLPTIIADSPYYSASTATRTELQTVDGADGEEVHTFWSPGDGVLVSHWVDGATDEPGTEYFHTWDFYSDLDLPSQTAQFTIASYDSRRPPYDSDNLVAVHPLDRDKFVFYYYESEQDGKYYGGFDFFIPNNQYPSANSFDSTADLLVSEDFSFDAENPVVTGLDFTRMNAILKINFVDKTDDGLFSKMGINSVTFGSKTGGRYLTGTTFCLPHDGEYEFYRDYFPEDFFYDEFDSPAYTYVTATYDEEAPCIGAIDAVYFLVHPTVLTNDDYPDGFPVKVELDDYFVTRNITLPNGGIELPAGLVTTLNISLYDNGVRGTTVTEKQAINFADSQVRSICLQYFDANRDGVLDMGEAARVRTLKVMEPGPAPKSKSSDDYLSPFQETGITSFDELRYFTGLELIESDAFANCWQLTSISIPDGVTGIEKNAFSGCGFESITIPSSVTWIEEGAFSWCGNLQSFQGKFASSDNKYLVCHGLLVAVAQPTLPATYSIPSDLRITAIGEYVFTYHEELVSVIIPEGVRYIGKAAFEDCSNLTTVSLPSTLEELEQEAFCWCTSLQSINFPDGLNAIGALAFQDCESLYTIVLPGSLEFMWDGAFLNCTGLTRVVLQNGMTAIGSRAFANCTLLNSVTLPNSLTFIGYMAFSGCIGLTEIDLPDHLNTIDEHAFEYCTGLTAITFPASIASIRTRAFKNCMNLSNMRFLGTRPPSLGYNNPFDYFDTEQNDWFIIPNLVIHVPASANHTVLNAYRAGENWSKYSSRLTDE